MPSYPTGIAIADLSVGPVLDMFGERATLTVAVVPVFTNNVKHITHTQSGYSFAGSAKTFYSDPNTGVATFAVPYTDQVGWQDPSGRMIDVSTKPGWSYNVTVSAAMGRTPMGSWTKNVQPLMSQTGVIDVDLVGEGPALQGELGAQAVVVSIGGLTGIVSVAQLEALGVGATGNLQIGTVTEGPVSSASVRTDADGVKYLDLVMVPGVEGPEGPMGRGLQITGRVNTRTDLDTITSPAIDDAYVVLDTGFLHIYGDTGWSEGIPFKGDKGDAGTSGRGISSIADTDEDGIATIIYTDGTSAQLPLPPGLDGVSVSSITDTDADGVATITYSNGTTALLQLPKGKDGTNGTNGADGRSVNSITDPDLDGTATITYSDGSTASLPLPKGPKGDMGSGLEITGSVNTRADLDTLSPAPVKDDAYITLDTGLLYIYDGAAWSSGIPFKGDKGDAGTNGTDGVGVSSIVSNGDGTATITYTDGTTGQLTLPEGPKGDAGTNGTDGVSVSSITDTDADGIATITYSNGTTAQLQLPKGQDGTNGTNGADGRSVNSITDTDANGTATITYSDGTTAELPLPKGQDGTNGTNGVDGRGFNPRGAWAASTVYAVDDVVTANGSTFRVITAHTSGTTAPTAAAPGANLELWASRGADGTNGTNGTNGADGYSSAYVPFLVKHNGTAWQFTTLADAEAAGLQTGQTAWFVGPTGTPAPAWAREGDMWTER